MVLYYLKKLIFAENYGYIRPLYNCKI